MVFFLAAAPFSLLATSAFALAGGGGGHAPPTTTTNVVAASGSSAASNGNPCRSNATHIGWMDAEDGNGEADYESWAKARAGMSQYLWANVMPYDVPNAQTLGFRDPKAAAAMVNFPSTVEHSHENDAKNNGRDISAYRRLQNDNGGPKPRQFDLVDGLSDGILNQTLYYSLQAKMLYPWTDSIPRSIYMEYVVPYAVVNEPRTDHRPLLVEKLRELLKEYERPKETNDKLGARSRSTKQRQQQDTQIQMKQAVKTINTHLWSIFGKRDADGKSQPIVFQKGLTPRIYDPLSVIAYGHSSCTGLAVLFIAALRAAGIPARMAGTPAWLGVEEKGNHSWVEVYLPNVPAGGGGEVGGRWIFLEPSPGIAEGDEDANSDDLDREPCRRWFCGPERFGDGSTKVYATRYDRTAASTHYPMAWAMDDEGVMGEDRSEYYNDVCGKCPKK